MVTKFKKKLTMVIFIGLLTSFLNSCNLSSVADFLDINDELMIVLDEYDKNDNVIFYNWYAMYFASEKVTQTVYEEKYPQHTFDSFLYATDSSLYFLAGNASGERCFYRSDHRLDNVETVYTCPQDMDVGSCFMQDEKTIHIDAGNYYVYDIDKNELTEAQSDAIPFKELRDNAMQYTYEIKEIKEKGFFGKWILDSITLTRKNDGNTKVITREMMLAVDPLAELNGMATMDDFSVHSNNDDIYVMVYFADVAVLLQFDFESNSLVFLAWRYTIWDYSDFTVLDKTY